MTERFLENFSKFFMMDALSDLCAALSEQELKEFNSKYGTLICKIRAEHTRVCEESNKRFNISLENDKKEQEKKRQEEKKKMEDEVKAQEDILRNMKIGTAFDRMIDAGKQAKSELEANSSSLDDFYKYYNIGELDASENEKDLEMKFAGALISKIESFDCDEYDYDEEVKAQFFKLLVNHPDKRVGAVAAVFTAMKTARAKFGSGNDCEEDADDE
jgi:hypothetical protein